jgi:hypothetical protein
MLSQIKMADHFHDELTALVQIDSFGELRPIDQDTSLSSEDRIPDDGRGDIFEAQAVQAKLPLANAMHQVDAREGGCRGQFYSLAM